MKNNLKIALAVLIILIVSVMGIYFLVLNSNKSEEIEIDPVAEFGEYTYKFSGKSKHYSFDNGFVLFKDDYSKISISGFKQTKKIKNLISETITVSFGDKSAFEAENKKGLNKLNKDKNIFFYEAGEDCIDEHNCTWDSFSFITKENFKESIKVIVEYCTNKECNDEEFKLEYK